MINVKSQNAMSEVLWYLKGIKKEDVDKIPKEIINFIKENASNEYKCTFDYNRPLKELSLLEETRGIIGILCYKYWCTTEEQKENYLKKLNYNEKKYQDKIKEKYNPEKLFKSNNRKYENIQDSENNMLEYKTPILKKIITKIKNFWRAIIKK